MTVLSKWLYSQQGWQYTIIKNVFEPQIIYFTSWGRRVFTLEQNFSSWLFVNMCYFSVSISTPLTVVYSFSPSLSLWTHWWFRATLIESPSQLIKQVWSTSSALFMTVPLICVRLVRLRVLAVRGLEAIAFFCQKVKESSSSLVASLRAVCAMITQLQTSVSNAAEVSLHWREFFITLSRCLAEKTASEAFVWSACCSADSMGQNVTKMDERGKKYESKSKAKERIYIR